MSKNKVTTILIVDDHRLFAEGLCRLLETLERSLVVKQCYSALQAIQLVDSRVTKIDLLLVDFFMPGIDGVGLLRAISERQLVIPTAVISATEDIEIINHLMSFGVSGFIPKSVSSEVMLSAVATLLNGDIYLPDELWDQLDFIGTGSINKPDSAIINTATTIGNRQLEVLRLMAAGSTNKQISTVLAISEATVKYHIGILFRVLGAKNRTMCIHMAKSKKIIV